MLLVSESSKIELVEGVGLKLLGWLDISPK